MDTSDGSRGSRTQLRCMRTKKGPPMTVSYEHVNVAPQEVLEN